MTAGVWRRSGLRSGEKGGVVVETEPECPYFNILLYEMNRIPGGELRIENSLDIWYSGLCKRYFQISNIRQVPEEEDEDKTMEQYK